jgi:hypothetical protein
LLIAGAGAVTAWAVPAIASNVVALPLPQDPRDPVFAALMSCDNADKCVADAVAGQERAEVAFLERFGTMTPDAFSKKVREGLSTIVPEFADCRTYTHEQIDNCRGTFPDEIVAAFHKELDLQKSAHKTIETAVADVDRAWDDYGDAFDVLVSTVPTSVAGLDVMIEYLRDNETARNTLDDRECMDAFLTTIKAAVANFTA